MISLDELISKARLKSMSLGNAEKDYLIALTLFSISKNTKDELVFKGGTCLSKFYNLDRFSEDIDFTAVKNIEISSLIDNIISYLKLFGIECSLHKKKELFNSILITLRCKGPLFKGNAQSYANVRIDINMKSSIIMPPNVYEYSSLYSEIPAFSLLIMQKKEILAEKIRAIMTRDKPRDIYDLWFLLKNNVEIEEKLISEKMSYSHKEFRTDELIKSLEIQQNKWQSELKPLLRTTPDFNDVVKLIKARIKPRK